MPALFVPEKPVGRQKQEEDHPGLQIGHMTEEENGGGKEEDAGCEGSRLPVTVEPGELIDHHSTGQREADLNESGRDHIDLEECKRPEVKELSHGRVFKEV